MLEHTPAYVPSLAATDLGRRQFLGGGALLGAAWLLGAPQASDEKRLGVKVVRGTLASEHWPGRVAGWGIAIPERPTGVVVALHGKGGSADIWFNLLRAADVAGATGLAVAAIDGGLTYWHPRKGIDTGAMVIDEFLPLIERHDLPVDRIGLTGISMGGFGALHIASRLGTTRVAAVATISAALRFAYRETSPGAFDDEADFGRNSIFRRVGRLANIPLHLSCGGADRFADGNQALARILPRVETTFDEGGHTNAYCTAHWRPAMQWLAQHI